MSKLIKLYEGSKFFGFGFVGFCAMCLSGIIAPLDFSLSLKLLLASLAPIFMVGYVGLMYLRVEAIKANAWNKVHEPKDYDEEFEAFLEGKKK